MQRDPGGPIPARELRVTGALAAALAGVASILYYGPGIASGSQLFFTHDIAHSDIWHMNLPMKRLYDDALSQGRLPLWAPELGTGFPLHAQGEVGALYPPNLLLYGLLPLVLAFNWSLLLHAALAAAFAAIWARELGAGRAGSLLAGVVFAFAGFFVVHVKHPAMSAAAVWAPLMLLAIERFARRASPAPVALFAIATACSWLAGHPQIAYYSLLVAGLWACILVLRRRRQAGAPGPLPFLGGLAWASLLGGLLAAPQLLPTWELNSLGPRRGGLAFEEATDWRYEWPHLAAFVRPGVFGDPGELEEIPYFDGEGRAHRHPLTGEPLSVLRGFRQLEGGNMIFWEMTGYVGLLPLLLAGAALVLGLRQWPVAMLGGLLLLSVLLALGRDGGLFTLFFYAVPGFGYFRFPSRFLLFADLALALLAGLGWTLLGRRMPKPSRWVPAASAGLIALCFLDQKLALGDHNPRVDAQRWLAPPPSAERILREESGGQEPFRILSNDPEHRVFMNAYFRARGWKGDLGPYDGTRNLLGPNLSALYRLDNLQIFFPLYPYWMDQTIGLLRSPAREPGSEPTRIHPGFASLWNVRYLLDPFGLDLPGFSHLESYAAGQRYRGPVVLEPPIPELPPFEIRLLRNDAALPRAFLVPGARVVADLPARGQAVPEAVRPMLAPGFDPRREVILVQALGQPPPATTPPGEPLTGGVRWIRYGPHELRLQVDAPRPCFLVLSDTFYPGWRARVDGAEREIHRANGSMRALRLDAGPAEVVFRYAPVSFGWGCAAGLLGLGLLATLPLQTRGARLLAARR